MQGNPIAPQNQRRKQHNNCCRAEKAQLLADNREDIVVILKGQIEIFLPAFSKSKAKKPAGTDGIETLQDLVSRISGVTFRVKPGRNAVACIAHEADIDHHEHRRRPCSCQEPPGAGARHKHHHHAHHAHKQNGAEVFFQCQVNQDAQHRSSEAQHAEAEFLCPRPIIAGQAGKHQNHGEFCNLRGLELDAPQVNPPPCAVDGLADDQHA